MEQVGDNTTKQEADPRISENEPEIERLDQDKAWKRISEIDFPSLTEKLKSGLFGVVRKDLRPSEEHRAIKSLARLLTELESKLSNYDTIISDDASARPFSLVLRNIIDDKRKENGMEPARTYFISGGRNNSPAADAELDKFIEKIADHTGKVLIVTEHIETGKSIMRFVKLLKKYGIKYDIASVSVHKDRDDGDPYDDNWDYPKEYAEEFYKHLYYGTRGLAGTVTTHMYKAIGVVRNNNSLHPVKNAFRQKTINEARKDIDIVSEELIKWLKTTKTQ